MLRQVIGPHVEVVEKLSTEPTPVLGDRSQIEQIIVNLAVNARDAMPTGGRLSIRTANEWVEASSSGEAVMPGQHVLLEVTDTGVGMDADTQSRIFEPFFTTKEFGRGTGLGLSTVYGIVKQMSGVVQVLSQPGVGSTFRIHLPAAHARETAAATAVAVKPPRGSETVLVVEDEAAVRSFLVDALQQHGYRVLAAEHQAAALSLVHAHTGAIDLVIADVVMPGGTGPELVRALAVVRPRRADAVHFRLRRHGARAGRIVPQGQSFPAEAVHGVGAAEPDPPDPRPGLKGTGGLRPRPSTHARGALSFAEGRGPPLRAHSQGPMIPAPFARLARCHSLVHGALCGSVHC